MKKKIRRSTKDRLKERDNSVYPQTKWKAGDTIKNGTLKGFSRNAAKKRKNLKGHARRKARRVWDSDFDLIGTRQDYYSANQWDYID